MKLKPHEKRDDTSTATSRFYFSFEVLLLLSNRHSQDFDYFPINLFDQNIK